MPEEENKAPEIDSGPTAPRPGQPEFLTNIRFDQFDLPTEVIAGLDDAGLRFCTPIQAETLPVSLTGKDVAGQAQTGTGKTAAFLLTVFNRLLANKDRKGPCALIIAPTRELAMQVYEDAEMIGKFTDLSLALVIGGIDYEKQARILRQGPDIVICTPGRIIDYYKQKIFKTDNIEVLVIDEADRLFDMGFIKDIRYLLRRLPPYNKRQSMLFSATLTYRELELTYEYMNLPEFISVVPEEVTVDGIEQSLFHVGLDEKMSLLLGILEREDWERVLIFVNTKAGVEWVAAKLKGNGLPAEGITGDLPQRKRLDLMEKFKDGKLKILVATDVASRGIHVEDISHVINYDLPQDPENYVHRIGRTARAGKKGKAISFACENYVFHLEPVEELLKFQIPVVWHDSAWLQEDEAGDIRVPRGRRDTRSPRTGRSSRGGGRPSRGGEKPEARRSSRSGAKSSGKNGEAKTPEKPRKPKHSRPGGIFGLAPGSWPEEESGQENGGDQKKKKKRRRRKKKPSGGENGGGDNSE